MSNISHIIEERAASIGNFFVGRLLPFREKRMVGPFIFIDHMGPATLDEWNTFEVGPHPHIGLSTLTFLFEGAIMHRDSIGTELEIQPGAVNLMTAGKGVVRSGRTPAHLVGKSMNIHGLQIWIALPKHLEQMEPNFVHIDKDGIPSWSEGNLHFKLIAGEVGEHKSAVPVYSDLYMIEVKAEEDAVVDFKGQLFGESGLYILEGEVTSDGNSFGPKQLLVTQESHLCAFEVKKGTTVYIFGGTPFEEERYIDWNFVSSDKDVLAQAKQRWIDHEFPKVYNDEEDYVPYPERTKK